MKAGTQNHLKLKRLKRQLGIPLYRAVGVLETLWLLCVDCCDEGDIGKFTDAEIAEYLEWDGPADPAALVRALEETGWVDLNNAGRPVVHDWLEHCPEFIRERIRKRRMRAQKHSKSQSSDHGDATYVADESDNNGHERTDEGPAAACPVYSQPNPTQPIQTQPTNPPTPQSSSGQTASDAGGRVGGRRDSGWGAVTDDLAELGCSRWRETISEAKQSGCTPGLAREIIQYGKANGYGIGGIVVRLVKARPNLPLAEGWPLKDTPEVSRKKQAATRAEREAEEQAELRQAIEQSKAGAKAREEKFGPELNAMDQLEVEELCTGNNLMLEKCKKKQPSPMLREWLLVQLEKRGGK